MLASCKTSVACVTIKQIKETVNHETSKNSVSVSLSNDNILIKFNTNIHFTHLPFMIANRPEIF